MFLYTNIENLGDSGCSKLSKTCQVLVYADIIYDYLSINTARIVFVKKTGVMRIQFKFKQVEFSNNTSA